LGRREERVGALFNSLQQKCNAPTIKWSFMKNVALHFITTLTKYSSTIQKVASPACKRNSCELSTHVINIEHKISTSQHVRER